MYDPEMPKGQKPKRKKETSIESKLHFKRNSANVSFDRRSQFK